MRLLSGTQRLACRSQVDGATLWKGVELEGLPDHGERDVADGDACGGYSVFHTSVGVSVDDEVGAGEVDCLGEEVAAEEGIDLVSLGAKRGFHRREMHVGYALVGVQLVQRFC